MTTGKPMHDGPRPRGIIGMSLQFRFLVIVVAAALMVFGITQLRHMPADVLPEFSLPYVEIQTEALGLTAEEVEQLITTPLEQNLLNGVAWLDKIRSESVAGLSSVTLVFEPKTDLYRARQMVAERLSQAAVSLPRVSKGPVLLQPKSATSRVLIVGLSSRKLSAIQMSVLARWTITPRLMGVRGVANVATWGMRDRQLQVLVDPNRLFAYNVSLLQVLESVGNALWVSSLSFVEAATPGNAGFIDTPQQRLGIQHLSPIVSPESLSQVSVQGTGTLLVNESVVDLSRVPKAAGAVRLIDVADVVENHQPLIGDALMSDGANLLLAIEKFPASDTVEVTRAVEEALASLSPGLGGMGIDSKVFRPATFIEMARKNLIRTGLVVSALIMLMIGLLFFNGRAALISILTIPLSLLAAVLVLHVRGGTLNVMVLIGLFVALGIVVDEAIIHVENIKRRLRQRSNSDKKTAPQSSFSILFESLMETRGALLFATPIGLLAVLPAFSLQNAAESFFQPLAVTCVLAMLASTCVALLITPALAAILLADTSAPAMNESDSPFVRQFQTGFSTVLERLISWPRSAGWALVSLAGLGLGALLLLRPALLPSFQERDLLVRLKAAPGTSHPAMVRIVDRAMREVRATPGIRNVSALVGRAMYGDQVVGINSAEFCVNMDPAADYDSTVAALTAAIRSYPGLESDVQTYLRKTAHAVAEEAGAPIVVRLYGQNWTVLRATADELRQLLAGIAGTADLQVELPVEEPTLEVDVDLAAAQQHGVNPGKVRRVASTFLNGLQVGSLFQEQKMFDVVVWSTPATRGNLTDINNLLIDTPYHNVAVYLQDVARTRIVPRPSLIRHEDVSRYLDIRVGTKGRRAGQVLADIQGRLRQFQFPLEYHAHVIGVFEHQQALRARLLAFGAVALIGILLLLHAAFESWRPALLSFLTLPLTLVGGLLGLVLADSQLLSLGALFGFVTVYSIAARHQVLLVSRWRELEREQGMSAGRERILQGTRERVTSLVMTMLTLGVAFAPLLFMGNTPGLEALRPAAIVILGGMLSCAGVNLLVVPALYLRWSRPAHP